MRSAALATVTVAFFVLTVASARSELGPQSPKPDRLWFALCTQSPIADGKEYDHGFTILIPGERAGSPVPETKLEIRRAADQKPVMSVAFEPFGNITTLPTGISTSSDGLSRDSRRELSALPEGDYVSAITEAGTRCSNVSSFIIQRGVKVEDRPVLEAIVLEPPPYRKLPFLALRVTGSNELEEAFHADAAHYAELIVDDIPRTHTITVWGGLNPELSAGMQWVRVIDPGGYLRPPIEPGERHKLEARVGKYSSGPIDFNPGQPAGEAWDTKTPR